MLNFVLGETEKKPEKKQQKKKTEKNPQQICLGKKNQYWLALCLDPMTYFTSI